MFASALVVVGCTFEAQPAQRDPAELPFGSVAVVNCMIASTGAEILLGDMLGPAEEDLTISKVVLNGSNGLEAVGVFVLDPAIGASYSTASELPQTEEIWEQREVAVGAAIPKGEWRNLVLEARVTADAASLDGFTVTFTRDGDVGSTTNMASFEVANDCDG